MPFNASLGLALPDYAREDLAWQEVFTVQPNSAGTYTYTVPGIYIDVMISIVGNFETTSGPGLRFPQLQYFDQNSNVLVRVLSDGGVGPSLFCDYAFMASLSDSYNVDDSVVDSVIFAFITMPMIPLSPTYQVNLQVVGAPGLSLVRPATFTVLHIPTGPPLEPAQLTAPTPILAS